MNQSIEKPQWMQYLELPIRKSAPVKLDHILAARMTAFMREKQRRIAK